MIAIYNGIEIKAPFFEIGPKVYLYGAELISLALAADAAAQKYNVQIIFTVPDTEISAVRKAVRHLLVFAQHIDPLVPGRGMGGTLPEAVRAAGAVGAMLNHAERPVTYSALRQTIRRADNVGLATIVCADSIEEVKSIALLSPNIIVAEPTELIGTNQVSDMCYVLSSIEAVKSVDPRILVLQAAGISSGRDVYNVIRAGAEATGSTSGILTAPNPIAMIDEMISALRAAWDDSHRATDKAV